MSQDTRDNLGCGALALIALSFVGVFIIENGFYETAIIALSLFAIFAFISVSAYIVERVPVFFQRVFLFFLYVGVAGVLAYYGYLDGGIKSIACYFAASGVLLLGFSFSAKEL